MFLPEGVINLAWLRSPERLMGDHGFLPPIAMGSVVEAGRQHTHTHPHTYIYTHKVKATCSAEHLHSERENTEGGSIVDMTLSLCAAKRNNLANNKTLKMQYLYFYFDKS